MPMNKLLLVDDEESILRVLSMSLRSDGYDVVTAGSGEQGLQQFRTEHPSIVLTDVRMPGMNGIELLQRIKDLNPDAEVIIITGHGDVDVAIEALQNGASDFIQKPVKDDALSIALSRAKEKIEIRKQLKAYTDDLEQMVKIATEEFQRKSNFQAKLIKSSNDGVIATDENWKIVIYNPGAERIFGFGRSEVMRKMDARKMFPPEVVQFIQDAPVDTLSEAEQPWQELYITAKNGDQIPVRFSGTLLREKNQMIGCVAFFQDLREIKRLESELVSAERLAAVGQTVAGMAHCIKNILHGFKGGSYMINVGIDNDNTQKLTRGWEMIQRQIQRTSDLVLDLLSYSKEREPEFEPCRPNEVFRDVCELVADNASDYNVELEQAFDPNIGEVQMDPLIVYRCLLNLASNAIDACIYDDDMSKSHCVTLGTALESENIIRFEVRDNGSGMSDEVKAKLFGSFFSTKGTKGTGLGLLVTQKLVQAHQGTISVESEKGKGTTFTIRLPFMNNTT